MIFAPLEYGLLRRNHKNRLRFPQEPVLEKNILFLIIFLFEDVSFATRLTIFHENFITTHGIMLK